MREVLPELMRWYDAGETIGVGTVVATFQSAPRPPGASMLVGPDGEAVGSVSGGCVEGAVYELAGEVVGSGEPVLQRYGISDDDAFAVGLTCGGILDVYVEKVSKETFPELTEIAADIEAGRPVALATVVEHPDPTWLGRRIVVRPDGIVRHEKHPESADSGARRDGLSVSGTLGSDRADDAVADDALGLLAHGRNATLGYGPDGERRGEGMRVFVWAFAPPPRMLVFGAIDFAAAVARVGAFLGYHVTVCDARPVFATNSRFPEADEVVVDWPHRYLRGRGRGRSGRPAHGALRADPRPEVRRPPARGGPAAPRGRLHRGDGLAAHPRGPARPAARGRRHRRRDRPAVQPDRPRPRRAYAGGDRGQHRGRDHRAPVGRHR